jgi:hypothetical protein
MRTKEEKLEIIQWFLLGVMAGLEISWLLKLTHLL